MTDFSADQMADGGMIPRFVQLLSTNQMAVLKYVICIVRNLACNNDENRVTIARCGGIQRLLVLLPHVSGELGEGLIAVPSFVRLLFWANSLLLHTRIR
jgi:hypothetical protein